MRFHTGTTRALILGSILLFLQACNGTDGSELLTTPHFPQQGERDYVMEALLEGELVLEGGCLRVKSEYGEDHLLIWPPGVRLTVDGRDVVISNGSGVSLAVGEESRVGGGEASLAHAQTFVTEPLPSDCPGPYWVVGEIPASGSVAR